MGLFSQQDAERYSTLAKERKDNLDGPPKLKQGIHVMKLIKAEPGRTADNSNHPNRQKIRFTYQDVKGLNAEVREELVVEGDEPWVDIHRKKLVERVVLGFGAKFKAAETIEEVAAWMNANFGGKPFKAAIQLEQRVWKKMDGPNKDVENWQLVEDPRIWYVGLHNEDLESKFNESRAIIMLKPDAQQEWDDYKERSGKGHNQGTHAAAENRPKPANTPAPTEARTAVTSDLDLPDMSTAAPAVVKPAAKSAAPQPAAAADDDLPDMGAATPTAKPATQAPAAAVEEEDPLAFLKGNGV